MKKATIFSLVCALCFSLAFTMYSQGGTKSVEAAKPVKKEKTVKIPATAKKVSDNVYYLGKKEKDGKSVEGYAVVHYDKKAKPAKECGNDICEPGENVNKCPADCGGTTPDPDSSSCYEFLARGAKWKTVEPYYINPVNSRGLDEWRVVGNMVQDVDKWETAASYDILGSGTSTYEVLEADMDSPDGLNEVYFGSIDDPGAIAITVIWGIFGGVPKNRELVEWDQIYDEVDYDWSMDCLSEDCGTKMDFESIATHELGHSVGMGDLYNTECDTQTMYGYADYGETNKRDLEAGDIAGVSKLY